MARSLAALLLAPALALPAPQGEAASRPRPVEPPASRPYSELAKLPKPKEGIARLYLARHGQSVGNATRDDPKLSDEEKDKLSNQGRKEAARLGEVVKSSGVHQLFHSPAVRAKETAAEAWRAAFPGLAPTASPLEGLRPLAPGKAPEAGVSPTGWLAKRWQAGEDPKLEGGESLADLCQRLKGTLPEIRKLASRSREPVLAFAHGEVLIGFYVGFDAAELRRYLVGWQVRNGAVLAFDAAENGKLEFLGYFVAPAEK